MPTKSLLHSKGSNFSATSSLKPNKHNLKKPQYPLKSALPRSESQTKVHPGRHSSQRLSYSVSPQLTYPMVFLPFIFFSVSLFSAWYRPMSTQIHAYLSTLCLLWTSVISVQLLHTQRLYSFLSL